MNSIKSHTTVQIPSYIGMPVCGRASVMTATDLVVRERAAAATTWADKRDMGLAQSFPGIQAWRPPSC